MRTALPGVGPGSAQDARAERGARARAAKAEPQPATDSTAHAGPTNGVCSGDR